MGWDSNGTGGVWRGNKGSVVSTFHRVPSNYGSRADQLALQDSGQVINFKKKKGRGQVSKESPKAAGPEAEAHEDNSFPRSVGPKSP